jgi:cytoskeletal protein CcmA (bactofilin family)
MSKDPQHEPVSILGPSLRFKGELRSDEALVIKGQLEGSITHSKRVTIGRGGLVKARIQADSVTVEGKVEGDIRANTLVSVGDSGSVTGDIRAPSVSIVEGAQVNGAVVMAGAKAARTRTESEDQAAAQSQTRGSSRV